MPRNKKQELIFTLIMAMFMVYFMSLYNIVLHSDGFHARLLLAALAAMLKEYFIAVPIAFVVGAPIAKKLALRLVPSPLKPKLMPYGISFCTVLVMVPIMTTIITIMQKGASPELPVLLLASIGRNYIFAMPLQVFFIGPFVRNIFSKMFSLSASANASVRS